MAQQIFLTIASLILAETDSDCILSPEEYIASYPLYPHKIYYGHGCCLGKSTTSDFYECLCRTSSHTRTDVRTHTCTPEAIENNFVFGNNILNTMYYSGIFF